MKIITLFLVLLPLLCNGQNLELDSCGIEDHALLNENEAQYFNEVKQTWLDSFDFKGKKLAFTYGNFGKSIKTKSFYFKYWGKEYYKNGNRVVNLYLILTPEEKKESGGFDVIVVSWSKFMINNKNRAKIIKRVNRKWKNQTT